MHSYEADVKPPRRNGLNKGCTPTSVSFANGEAKPSPHTIHAHFPHDGWETEEAAMSRGTLPDELAAPTTLARMRVDGVCPPKGTDKEPTDERWMWTDERTNERMRREGRGGRPPLDLAAAEADGAGMGSASPPRRPVWKLGSGGSEGFPFPAPPPRQKGILRCLPSIALLQA